MTKLLLACFPLLLAASCPAQTGIHLSDAQALDIGKKIFQNEAGGKAEFLVHWNEGEEFASLGIGHFIWYPKDYHGPFEESFPPLVRFLVDHGKPPPAWVVEAPYCPWNTKAELDREKQSPRTRELRDFLAATISLQARFAADRLEKALPKILAAAPADRRDELSRQFYRVAQDPRGVYALMDYVNFKGEGVKETERYDGQGWGLLQVLDAMTGDAPGQPALDEFVRSAGAALTTRVRNSPPERHEERWLPGWKKRLETYRAP